MRPWLVVLGTSFLLVGGGALVAILLLPPPSIQQQSSAQLVSHATLPESVGVFPFAGASNAMGSLTVSWTSTARISVALNAATCSGGAASCSGPVLAAWPLNSSGSLHWSGKLDSNYALAWTTPAHVYANVSATALVSWQVSPPATLAQITAEVASGILAVVGGIGLFLGLFLRGDFRAAPPIVSRSADDANEVAGLTGPRTGSSDGGSGPLRPGPPSRSR
ncbi:MAG: hypothetical protein L3K18_01740 [Thermoplasmata archaeon]|nr:hypothetical protein [Thermoplasmata archaeon]MCI4355851.1 hypothetical protein [Thermoplasmata archaeon]